MQSQLTMNSSWDTHKWVDALFIQSLGQREELGLIKRLVITQTPSRYILLLLVLMWRFRLSNNLKRTWSLASSQDLRSEWSLVSLDFLMRYLNWCRHSLIAQEPSFSMLIVWMDSWWDWTFAKCYMMLMKAVSWSKPKNISHSTLCVYKMISRRREIRTRHYTTSARLTHIYTDMYWLILGKQRSWINMRVNAWRLKINLKNTISTFMVTSSLGLRNNEQMGDSNKVS